jgi:hypothetical protein
MAQWPNSRALQKTEVDGQEAMEIAPEEEAGVDPSIQCVECRGPRGQK